MSCVLCAFPGIVQQQQVSNGREDIVEGPANVQNQQLDNGREEKIEGPTDLQQPQLANGNNKIPLEQMGNAK